MLLLLYYPFEHFPSHFWEPSIFPQEKILIIIFSSRSIRLHTHPVSFCLAIWTFYFDTKYELCYLFSIADFMWEFRHDVVEDTIFLFMDNSMRLQSSNNIQQVTRQNICFYLHYHRLLAYFTAWFCHYNNYD